MSTLAIEQKTTDPLINICLDTLSHNKQAFIFVNSKRSAQKVAQDT
jgi:replicative superfamily II helicase